MQYEVKFPSDTAQWLLGYFLGLPMKDSENIVNHIRALIKQAEDEINNDEAPVPQPGQ